MIRLIFSNVWFVLMAACIFATMTFSLLIMSEYVFLEPYVTGHVPRGTELGLSLILAVAVLSALVIPANVYRITVLNRSGQKVGPGLAGSVVGIAAGACSCGPLGFTVISTFGSVGAAATSFLTAYELPLRVAAVAVLVLTYATTERSLKRECSIRSGRID